MANVADRIVETLEAANVRHIYGLVGDSLNGITESLRVREKIEWIAVRHEEVAALKMNGKRRLVGSFLHGSMANAMPQAIGAQFAMPGRQVISMSGDGGFGMLMGDLLTVRHFKLPIKIVIFNNGLLGFVGIEMKAGGFLPIGTRLDNPNFASMAESMGIYGVRVEDPGQLKSAISMAFAHEGPAVIDVLTDRQELVMPPEIKLEQAKGFSLWMMKAVLNGQANEILDVAKTALVR